MPRPSPELVKARLAEIDRRYRRKKRRGRPSIATIRVRELGRLMLARHGAALPDDKHGHAFAEIMLHHLAALGGDGRPRMRFWLSEHATWMALGVADAIINDAFARPQRWTADQLAWRLRLSRDDRAALRITTIGAIDESRPERAKRRKVRRRKSQERRRRATGMKARADYEAAATARAKPWQALGISRTTWYERRRRTPGQV